MFQSGIKWLRFIEIKLKKKGWPLIGWAMTHWLQQISVSAVAADGLPKVTRFGLFLSGLLVVSNEWNFRRRRAPARCSRRRRRFVTGRTCPAVDSITTLEGFSGCSSLVGDT